ncbi:MAG: 4-hydroxy-3-methylbut-2-enyl diphosphate reductase, partial [Treponema sp.]|nr:4-hydroxy-3-methylbut-2-enyl diphosphate reductase [Treponema sp.]
MNVIRASVLGFCMGVRRAVEMARRESPTPDARVYTLGPLIHNPIVLKDLEDRGISILGDGEIPPEPEKSTVIIRAHGVSPRQEADIALSGARILDATCPHVKQSQMKARYFAEKGYLVFLAGEENHGEIAGIRGYAEDAGNTSASCCVVGSPQDAQRAGADLSRICPGAKAILIGQTTISAGEYHAIGEILRQFFPALEMLDTICAATA